jgi:[ribosomal protein S5]-alanine N-acetyltransferase
VKAPIRVRLEPVSLKRVTEFLALAKASRAFHKPWVEMPLTVPAFKARMEKRAREGGYAFFICRDEDNALVGVVNVSQPVRGHLQSVYLGYWVFAPYANRGYMTKGLGLVLREVFVKLRFHRAEANIQPTNEPSRKLANKLGFRLEGFSPKYLKVNGRWTDHERWAMTKDMWRPSRRKA